MEQAQLILLPVFLHACGQIITQRTAGNWTSLKVGKQVRVQAPGIMPELNRRNKNREIWPKINGVRQKMIQVDADGPLLKAYLNVFSIKLGMALYREHVGHPLPETGEVFTRWFLNSGLAQQSADDLLSMMPVSGTLRQGTLHVADQFYYRYNCDDQSILAALAKFHSGLYIMTLATSKPHLYTVINMNGPSDCYASPGDLKTLMPNEFTTTSP